MLILLIIWDELTWIHRRKHDVQLNSVFDCIARSCVWHPFFLSLCGQWVQFLFGAMRKLVFAYHGCTVWPRSLLHIQTARQTPPSEASESVAKLERPQLQCISINWTFRLASSSRFNYSTVIAYVTSYDISILSFKFISSRISNSLLRSFPK